MSRPLNDSDPKKWKYHFHNYVKHSLFEKYFETWSRILGSRFSQIGYFDGFAGRGEYDKGQYGSPLLALRALTKTQKYYKTCLCVFVEKNQENYESLTNLINEKKHYVQSTLHLLLFPFESV